MNHVYRADLQVLTFHPTSRDTTVLQDCLRQGWNIPFPCYNFFSGTGNGMSSYRVYNSGQLLPPSPQTKHSKRKEKERERGRDLLKIPLMPSNSEDLWQPIIQSLNLMPARMTSKDGGVQIVCLESNKKTNHLQQLPVFKCHKECFRSTSGASVGREWFNTDFK